MIQVFAYCSKRSILKFEKLLEGKAVHGGKEIELDLEAEFSSLALDIIGLSVFNYDFGSVTKESPVIKVSDVILLLMLHSFPVCYVFSLLGFAIWHSNFFFILSYTM